MLRHSLRSVGRTFVALNSKGQVHKQTRGFAEGKANRRPKRVKVKKGEGRRVVREQPEQSALTTTSEAPPPSNQVYEPQYYQEQPLGERLKTSFLWGLGISLGFSIVGVFFRAFMEEDEGQDGKGLYEASEVLTGEEDVKESLQNLL